MFHTTVKCVDCGTVMVDVPGNTKRCAACRVGHNRESVRRANETRRAEEAVERFNFQIREISDSVMASLVNDAEQEQEEAQSAAHKSAKKGGCEG